MAVVASNIIWGLTGYTIKIAINDIEPMLYVFLRFALVSVFLLPWALKAFPRKLNLKTWMFVLVVGLLSGPINYIFVTAGLKNTNLSTASFILLIEPIAAFVFAKMLLHERYTKMMSVGLFTALVGSLFIALSSAGGNIAGVSLFGNIMVLGLVAVSTIDLLMTKRIMGKVDPRFLLWLMAFMSTVFSIPFINIGEFGSELATLTPAATFGILWGVVASTLIGYLCYYFAIKVLRAGEVGIFRYLDPVVGVTAGFVFLGEAFSPIYLIGGAIVVIGIILAKSSASIKHFTRRSHKKHRHHIKHHILRRA